MSYRIHLNIFDKKKFEEYKNNFNYEEEYGFNLDNLESKKDLGIMQSLDLKEFSNLKLKQKEEYNPKILTKDDLLKIIKFYQKKIKDGFNEKETDPTTLKYIYTDIHSYFLRLSKTKELLIADNGFYFLDYFYIVDMYKNFDSKKEVLIITHG